MFSPKDIIYEDNHLLIINKHAGDLAQGDNEGEAGVGEEVKSYIKKRDNKPGNVYLGLVHRVDRPVSGVLMFAKTSKALARLNEMMKNREVKKFYWAITEESPEPEEGTLRHHIIRDGRKNYSHAYNSPKGDSKEAILKYKLLAGSTNYKLIEVELITGRHHQIRCQLSKIGCPIKGDLKYGAKRSNQDGSISLHARSLEFTHPVTKEIVKVVAPAPLKDSLWSFFEESQS